MQHHRRKNSHWNLTRGKLIHRITAHQDRKRASGHFMENARMLDVAHMRIASIYGKCLNTARSRISFRFLQSFLLTLSF